MTVRVIAGVDRQHYSVSPMPGWATPPATCPVETETDEETATAVGAGGIELLPTPVRNRISAMWEAAQDRAQRLGMGIEDEDVTEWILTLIEGRVGLVQGPDDLQRARASMETLITAACEQRAGPGVQQARDVLPERSAVQPASPVPADGLNTAGALGATGKAFDSGLQARRLGSRPMESEAASRRAQGQGPEPMPIQPEVQSRKPRAG